MTRAGTGRPRREVWLEGEAFYRATRGARPFVVRTYNAQVTVLGTRFGVRARDEWAGGTAVTVEEGRVRVGAVPAAAASGGAVVLGAGERTVVAAGAACPAPAAAPVAQLLAWRPGGFAAVDLPLDAIARELERQYRVDLVLRAGAAAGDRLTPYYPRPVGVEAILADICAAARAWSSARRCATRSTGATCWTTASPRSPAARAATPDTRASRG